MTALSWFDARDRGGRNAELYARLRRERLVFEAGDTRDLEALRADGRRIARDMDDPDRPPPMLWSGIPLPPAGREASCDYQLVVSVGGTKTDFALLRLERGMVRGLDVATGTEVASAEKIDLAREAMRMNTPRLSPETPSGLDMVRQIAAHAAGHLRPHRDGALRKCEAILLSWGFAHRIVRTGPQLAGGLAGIVTMMTKDQSGFTKDLKGKNIGELLVRELEARLGWSRPVAVANDTVMALHYFLGPEWRPRFHRIGLFINGTGSNFALAEPCAIRPGGIISAPGEEHQPDRITGGRPLRPGETAGDFFINYEAGSTGLEGTRTRFDTETEYPIERNALAGGNAFTQQLRELARAFLGEDLQRRLFDGWKRSGGSGGAAAPGGREVGRLSAGDGSPETAAGIFGGAGVDPDQAAALRLIARAIVHRSAMHAALILYAVTLRNGFGRGGAGRPDLAGMEGSLWRIEGYSDLVQAWWQALLGSDPLRVEFGAEPDYNASLPGPLYLAALHRQ